MRVCVINPPVHTWKTNVRSSKDRLRLVWCCRLLVFRCAAHICLYVMYCATLLSCMYGLTILLSVSLSLGSSILSSDNTQTSSPLCWTLHLNSPPAYSTAQIDLRWTQMSLEHSVPTKIFTQEKRLLSVSYSTAKSKQFRIPHHHQYVHLMLLNLMDPDHSPFGRSPVRIPYTKWLVISVLKGKERIKR